MSQLKINKSEVIDQLLQPISRVSEECSLTVTSDSFSTLINDTSEAIILYTRLKTNTGIPPGETYNLNFKDVRKLIKIFDCIKSNVFDLKIGDNASTISHKSADISFKLHLVMDNVIKKCTASLDKISSLTFESTFELTKEKIQEIIKGSVFTTNADKVYFYTKDGSVYAELTDKVMQDVDSITFSVVPSFTGSEITTPLPFNMEVLRLINSTAFDKVTVKINNKYKILLFEICMPNAIYKYIVPGYTK